MRRGSGAAWAAVLAAVLLVGACSSGNQFSADTGDVAQRFIPTSRETDHHPDSLAGLAVVEDENKIKFKMESSYQSLLLDWTTRPRDVSANRSPMRNLTYATLWSRELSLASLEAEAAVTSLSKDQAKKMIDRREEEYRDFLQIDVYWFGSPNRSAIAGPGTFVKLKTSRDSTYRTSRRDYGPVREAFVDGGRTALYRRNTFYFDRQRNGHDILDDVSTVTLEVRPTNSTRDFRFTWTWEGAPQSASAEGR